MTTSLSKMIKRHIDTSQPMTLHSSVRMHSVTDAPPTGCTNAQLVSALDSEDTGTLNVGYGMQSFPSDLWNAAFGYQDISTNETLSQIPAVGTGSNYGPKECLARCAAMGTNGNTTEGSQGAYSYTPDF